LHAIEVEADHLFVERAPRDFERIEDRGDVAAVFRQGGGDQRAFIGRDAGGEGAVPVEETGKMRWTSTSCGKISSHALCHTLALGAGCKSFHGIRISEIEYVPSILKPQSKKRCFVKARALRIVDSGQAAALY
jgi:hypothetical protein